MMGVFKSEWYRLFRGKMLYICTGIVTGVSVLSFLMMKLVLTFELEGSEALMNQLGGLTASKYLATRASQGLSDGTLYIVLAVVASYLITHEFKEGTMKYTLLMKDRPKVYLGKLLTYVAMTFWFVFSIGVAHIVVATLGFQAPPSLDSVLLLIGALCASALLFSGFGALLMALFVKIDQLGAAIGLGIGLYIASTLVELFLPEVIKPLLFTYSATLIDSMGAYAVALQGAFYLAIFGTLGLKTFQRREIC